MLAQPRSPKWHNCPEHINPAEFLADLISVDYSSAESVYSSKKRIAGLVESFSLQVPSTVLANSLSEDGYGDLRQFKTRNKTLKRKKNNWWRQFRLLLKRAWMQSCSPCYNKLAPDTLCTQPSCRDGFVKAMASYFISGTGGDMDLPGGLDASGRKAKGKGVYQYVHKYGANVDGYSPIYNTDECPLGLQQHQCFSTVVVVLLLLLSSFISKLYLCIYGLIPTISTPFSLNISVCATCCIFFIAFPF